MAERKRKRRSPDENRVGEINMMPMIDVTFLLLIFFMLTMRFKLDEGKLLTTLPKSTGTASSPSPELEEIRVILCCGGNTKQHERNKGEHEKGDPKDPAVVSTLVGRHDCGQLAMTEREPAKKSENRSVYQRIGSKVYDIYAATKGPDGKSKTRVVIDADSETPYEHIIGVVNQLQERGIRENIEFAANPRFDLYYGSKQRGQFQRK